MSAFVYDLAGAVRAPFAQFLLDAAAKATVLLVAATLATALLRHSSAAVRHRIWCLTFAALVLLPGLSAALPEWRLAVLPQRSPLALRSPLAPQAEGASIYQTSMPVENDLASHPVPLAEQAGYRTVQADHGVSEQPGYAETFRDKPEPAAVRPPGLAGIWLMGAVLLLLPVVAGLARTSFLRRRSVPIDDAPWTVLLDELRQRLALGRRVRLYENPSALMPMTWGVLRPLVMLPRQAHEWTDRLRRIVLLHELAHVKRCDVACQLLGRIACALYWFHPLAWYALRRLRIERELACDDCVVLAGERATDYAAELVQIARSYRAVPLAVAVAMAQRSNLEHRLRAMFDRACSHLPLGARTARILLASVLVLVTTVAAVRLAPRATANEKEEANADALVESSQKKVSAHDAVSHHLNGRVVDEKGQPVGEARVIVLRVDSESGTWRHRERILAETRSGAGGEFSVDYASLEAFTAREHFTEPSMIVLASADGYACDWHYLEPGEEEIRLALSGDDVPLEGRVLDLEGRPIRGVSVGVERIAAAAKELGEWIEEARQNPVALADDWMMQPISSPKRRGAPKVARFPGHKSLWGAPTGLLPSTVTDDEGRFKLEGLGRGRLIQLQLEGGNIAKTWVNAVTREMPPVPYPQQDPRFRVPTCFGRRFDFSAEPDQPIVGEVRDADSGRPLPGVEVRLEQYADSLLLVEGFLSTVADGEGRYTLRGVPKPHDPERRHRLRFVPRDDQPYFRTDIQVAKREGLDPLRCDVGLKRAIWLRGRVTDAVTGKPVLGLVEYYPFLTNEAAVNYPNFIAGLHSVEGERYPTRDDGTYRLPTLPGRGIVVFIAQRADRYPEADGADAIAGLHQKDGRDLNIYHLHSTELSTAVRDVNPADDADESVCDIKLQPLDTVEVALFDADGRPLSGVLTRRGAPVHIAGWPYRDQWSTEPFRAATAEIVGPRDQYRTVMFLHRERKLAAALSLSPDRDPPRQVVLRASSTVSGRVVDAEHKPVADFYIHVNAAAAPSERPTGWARASFDNRHQLDSARTDQDGKFQVDLVPPSIAYVVSGKSGSARFEKTTPVIEPGQSLDLGDLVLETADKEATERNREKTENKASTAATDSIALAAEDTSPANSSERAGVVTVRGRVLDPEGKPLSGARLYLSYPTRTRLEPQLLGLSGEKGRFELHVDTAKLDRSFLADPWTLARLTAAAEGYGVEWTEAAKAAAAGDFDLQVVKDVPIHGRILTLEGKPVAGAKIRFRQLRIPVEKVWILTSKLSAPVAGSPFVLTEPPPPRPACRKPQLPMSKGVSRSLATARNEWSIFSSKVQASSIGPFLS
ncbi:MAG TPA: M56 family metallopeptidase [Pirellulales bacterium]|nr:M56 family metallopeptidase [Pirellulales bacterium]